MVTHNISIILNASLACSPNVVIINVFLPRLFRTKDIYGFHIVSRTSIRDALQMLELRGAIDIRRRGGSYFKSTEFPPSTEELSSVITKAEIKP